MAKIKVKRRKGFELAYIEHRGAYSEIPFDEYIKRLYGWAKEKNARPGFKPMTIYPDNPEEVAEAERRSWVGIPIGKVPEEKGDIQVKAVAEGDWAVLKFKGGSEDFKPAYKTLADWVCENGYKMRDAPMEIYTGKPKEKGGKTVLKCEIWFPVEKS